MRVNAEVEFLWNKSNYFNADDGFLNREELKLKDFKSPGCMKFKNLRVNDVILVLCVFQNYACRNLKGFFYTEYRASQELIHW